MIEPEYKGAPQGAGADWEQTRKILDDLSPGARARRHAAALFDALEDLAAERLGARAAAKLAALGGPWRMALLEALHRQPATRKEAKPC